MPSLSPTMEVGTIVKWHKKEGDSVSAGDQLCEIQTDKAVMSFDMEDEGVIAKILKQENEEVAVGNLIALMVEEGEDWKGVEVPADADKAPPKPAAAKAPSGDAAPQKEKSGSPAPAAAAAPAAPPAASKPASSQTDKLIGPAVRNLIDVYQLDASKIQASGKNNRILKWDAAKYIEDNGLKPAAPKTVAPPASTKSDQKAAKPKSAAAPPPVYKKTRPGENPFIDKEINTMRRVTAQRLTESKSTIPHFYSLMDCEVDNVMRLRQELMQSQNIKVSMNDFVIKAAAISLARVPRMNATFKEPTATLQEKIDISIAVATPDGLITPIVTDAISRDLVDISGTVKELSGRAREGKLKLHEFQGGSFTISNLGMFGIREFSAVINPPQVAILAVGGTQELLGAQARTRRVMTVQLSCDRRAVDDVDAAMFLQVFRDTIQNPMAMFAGGLHAPAQANASKSPQV